jgi:DNA-binding MarR family transcriptional regulator
MKRRTRGTVVSPTRAGETAPAPEVLAFMRLMWAVDHALQRASKRMNRTIGLTGPQRLVIRTLGEQPGLSPGEIATRLHLDPSTLTGIIQRLERRGLVLRQRDPDDGRRYRLDLSEKGRRATVPSAGTIEAAVADTLAGCRPAEVRSARAFFQRLAAQLEALPAALERQGRRRSRR